MSKSPPQPRQEEKKKEPFGELIKGIDAIGAIIRRTPNNCILAKRYDNLPMIEHGGEWVAFRADLDEWTRAMVLNEVDLDKDWGAVLAGRLDGSPSKP